MVGQHNENLLFSVMEGLHKDQAKTLNSSLFHVNITTTHCLLLFRSDITKRKGEILHYFVLNEISLKSMRESSILQPKMIPENGLCSIIRGSIRMSKLK